MSCYIGLYLPAYFVFFLITFGIIIYFLLLRHDMICWSNDSYHDLSLVW